MSDWFSRGAALDAPAPADWYAPGASAKAAAMFRVNDAGEAEIVLADGRRHRAEWHEVKVSPRLADVPRRLEFPGGGWASVADNDAIDRALAAAGRRNFGARAGRFLHFMERRLWAAAVLLCVAAAVGFAVVRVGIPAAADYAAAKLPGAPIEQLGDEFYERLREQNWLQTSRLPTAELWRAHAVFDEVAADLNGEFRNIHIGANQNAAAEFNYRLRVHAFSFGDDDDGDGDDDDAPIANAFALPSGIVVFTDALVERLDDAQLAAVAAHEIGHVQGRHALRILIRSASVLALFGVLSGDVSGLAIAPVVLAQLQYSRDFETEADCFAYRYMAAKGIAWETFGQALARIEADPADLQNRPATRDRRADRDRDRDGVTAKLLALLSSHPPSDARADPAAHCRSN